MSDIASSNTLVGVFRVDKFVVSKEALPAFLEKMRHIQVTVRTLPGCLRDLLLTQTGGAGEFNVVHWVEWSSAEAIAAAQPMMQKKLAEEGFDPAEFFLKKLGAKADFGLYAIA